MRGGIPVAGSRRADGDDVQPAARPGGADHRIARGGQSHLQTLHGFSDRPSGRDGVTGVKHQYNGLTPGPAQQRRAGDPADGQYLAAIDRGHACSLHMCRYGLDA